MLNQCLRKYPGCEPGDGDVLSPFLQGLWKVYQTSILLIFYTDTTLAKTLKGPKPFQPGLIVGGPR